jgi:hypothetical protein
VFLLDDLLLAPMRGLASVCRKVEEAARTEFETREQDAMHALSELHRRFELGQMREEEFDAEETRVLDQIEALQKVLHPENDAESR